MHEFRKIPTANMMYTKYSYCTKMVVDEYGNILLLDKLFVQIYL